MGFFRSFLPENPEKVLQEESKREQVGKQSISKPTLPCSISALSAPLPPGHQPASFTSYKTPGKTETFTYIQTVSFNYDGHWVMDVMYSDGYEANDIFCKNGTVEIITQDGQVTLDSTSGTWKQKSGNVEAISNEGSVSTFFSFKPRLNPG